jgi:hypothetical protein
MGRIIKVCPDFVEFSGILIENLAKVYVCEPNRPTIKRSQCLSPWTGDTMTTLMAIGGALNMEEPRIFQEFIQRAGGKGARIVVLPQASSLPETGKEYGKVFKKLGVKQARFRGISRPCTGRQEIPS